MLKGVPPIVVATPGVSFWPDTKVPEGLITTVWPPAVSVRSVVLGAAGWFSTGAGTGAGAFVGCCAASGGASGETLAGLFVSGLLVSGLLVSGLLVSG
jgi:hypothetical protein